MTYGILSVDVSHKLSVALDIKYRRTFLENY